MIAAALALAALQDAELAELVDGFFEHEMEELHVPGGVFVLVRGTEVVHLRGYGVADLESGRPVDPERTAFRVGSVSKTFTAAAALQLVERGALDLDADVNAHLDGWSVPATFPEPVTLHHLLTHTAGFTERLMGQHARAPEAWLPLDAYLQRHLPRRAWPPGLVLGYNDHGTALAGLLVERAGDRPFARYAQEELFEPLGMERSTFEQVELPPAVADELARAYRWDGERHHLLARDYVHTTPAAGLFTTAGDMARFLLALLNGGALDGRRVLSEESARAMLSVQFQHGAIMLGRGYGFAELDANGRLGFEKSGQCSGFLAQVYVVPSESTAWFSATNLSMLGPGGSIGPVAKFHDRLGEELLDALFPVIDRPEEAVYDEPPPPAPCDTARFIGTYRSTSDPRDTWDGCMLVNEMRVEVAEDGALRILGLEPWVELEPLRFQYGGGGPHFVRFFTDGADEVRWVTYHSSAWERVPWYATRSFAKSAAQVLLGILATAPLVALLRLWSRRRGRPWRACPGSAAATAAAGAQLLFALGWAWALLRTDPQVLFSGPTAAMLGLLALPPLALVASAIALLGTIRAWRAGAAGPLQSGYYSILVLASLMATLLLAEWGLLGWRL